MRVRDQSGVPSHSACLLRCQTGDEAPSCTARESSGSRTARGKAEAKHVSKRGPMYANSLWRTGSGVVRRGSAVFLMSVPSPLVARLWVGSLACYVLRVPPLVAGFAP